MFGSFDVVWNYKYTALLLTFIFQSCHMLSSESTTNLTNQLFFFTQFYQYTTMKTMSEKKGVGTEILSGLKEK